MTFFRDKLMPTTRAEFGIVTHMKDQAVSDINLNVKYETWCNVARPMFSHAQFGWSQLSRRIGSTIQNTESTLWSL